MQERSTAQQTDASSLVWSQLTERKNALEIELFESLIRKRDGFRAQIESLNLPATGATQTADDIDARKREVASLKKAVDDLKEQIKGACLQRRVRLPQTGRS